jgi:hypothetical protein
MLKKKYEKPVSRNLSSIDIARGSCISGHAEYTVIGSCGSGANALIPCTSGGVVLRADGCFAGSFAGYSCVNGHEAG